MIGVDWGTSTLRAFLLADDGTVREHRAAPRGILQVPDGAFAATLREFVSDWLEGGERRVLLAGMIGSRQGWQEAAYLPCPAGIADLAGALARVPFEGAEILLVPGLSAADESGVPEVLRGEEVQVLGALDAIGAEGAACLPGSHSKWVRVAGGRIAGFSTHLTGEAFAALRGHTILGRMMRDGAADQGGFDRGVARSDEPGGLLHHLFGVRTLGLTGRLPETESAAYLSGLLIGHEVRAALAGLPGTPTVHLIGDGPLCALYGRAITACGGVAVTLAEDAAARGLAEIGRRAPWR